MAFLEKIKNLLAKRFRKLIRSTSSVFKLKEDNASKNKRWPAKAVKKAERKAAELEYLLQTLGFTERAVEDLKKIINSMKNKYPKGPAVRVLACWYANQRSIEGAQRCLDLLTQAAGDDDNRDLLNATAIMKAESFEMLGDIEAGKSVISRALEAGPDPSLFLAAANLEFSIYKRLKWVNRALAFYNIPAVSYVQGHGPTTLDCIRTLDIFTIAIKELPEPLPKVTVIMSTYNTEKYN
jgi:tetratricopeptide (TPR) repeat protein